MHPAQLLRAVEVVQRGELAAPRGLLRYYLLSEKESPKIGELSARQREILEMVVEGLSNGVYDQAAPARCLQGAWGAQQDTGCQSDAGALLRRLRERGSLGREERTLSFLSPYALECVEGESSEVELPIYGVLRSSHSPGPRPL